MRINARLDESHARKLELLRRRTGHRVSDLIKEAIDLYYEEVQATPERPADALAKAGFIGCGEADPVLSENYKQLLTDSLAAKHGDR